MDSGKIRVLLVEDDPGKTREFRNYINRQDMVELVGITEDGLDAVRFVQESLPDAVILNMELPEGTGIDFLYQIRMVELPFLPYIVVTTGTAYRPALQNARQNGKGFVFQKNSLDYSPKKVVQFLLRMQENFESRKGGVRSGEEQHIKVDSSGESLRKRIAADLCAIYITPNLRGHHFMKEAVMILKDVPSNQPMYDMTNEIYPKLAEKFSTTPGNVERCIRTALEIAWSKPDIQELASHIYPVPIGNEGGRPSNRTFLFTYAEKFRK